MVDDFTRTKHGNGAAQYPSMIGPAAEAELIDNEPHPERMVRLLSSTRVP
jgi:hypothetical protein